MNYNQSGTYLTAKIVSKYVAHHRVASDQIADLINTVHQAIGHLGQPSEPKEALTPAVSVRRSVRHDYVVCLDCGFRAQTLRRHVRVQHGLNRIEYLRRWGLKADHPLTAPAYSERRSTMAKTLGLGRKASIEAAPAKTPIAAEPETQLTPKRRPRTRRATKPAGVTASEAAAGAPTPARRGRPRSRAGVASQP